MRTLTAFASICALMLGVIHPGPLCAATPPPYVGYDNVVVVVIGISDYPGEPLPNATRDARKFADLFRVKAAHVRIVELYDAQATRGAIIGAVRERAPAKLPRGGDRNLLIVYFVGHGRTADGVGFIAPHGARGEGDWLPMSRLRDIARQSDVFRHQLYILGSCFGGDVLRSVDSAPPVVRQKDLAKHDAVSRWVADGLSRRARVALTAGSAREKVPDGKTGRGSPFGNALVNALRVTAGAKHMAADFNRDGCVSHAELTAYVEGYGRSPHNTPRSGKLDGDDAGTVVLCQRAFSPAGPATDDLGPDRDQGLPPRPEGLPPDFVQIPAGTFVMGSPADEDGRAADEGPQRRVTLTRPLWVQTHEVMQRDWRSSMGTSPSFRSNCDTCPVERVSWYDAVAYANARSRAEELTECYALKDCADTGAAEAKGLRCASATFVGTTCDGYRLPTEAEWEYFARAGTSTRHAGGDGEAELAAVGWYAANSEGRTHRVGQKDASPWGLRDVHGNVHEWCHDWQGSYGAAPVTDPTGPDEGRFRVIRGGAFDLPARASRSAARGFWFPEQGSANLGFRLVRTPPGG